jgi:hypothetical protein
MSEIIHVKISSKHTLTLPIPLQKILKNNKIPDELDIVIIDKKPKNLLENVSGWFDFDDELLDRVDRLEMEQ